MGAVALTMTRANPDSIVCRRSSRQGRSPRYALGCSTVDPPPGSGGFAFRIWRVENCLRQEWPAAPDALKVMCAKNFSTPAKFGIMPEVSEND